MCVCVSATAVVVVVAAVACEHIDTVQPHMKHIRRTIHACSIQLIIILMNLKKYMYISSWLLPSRVAFIRSFHKYYYRNGKHSARLQVETLISRRWYFWWTDEKMRRKTLQLKIDIKKRSACSAFIVRYTRYTIHDTYRVQYNGQHSFGIECVIYLSHCKCYLMCLLNTANDLLENRRRKRYHSMVRDSCV